MNRVTSVLAVGTVTLFAATSFALAQAAPDAAASGSPSAAPAEAAAAAEGPAAAPVQQTNPSDEPAQAGGMHNTSDLQKNGAKPCEPTVPQSSSPDPAKSNTGCRKPK
jgi:hypothetical protein